MHRTAPPDGKAKLDLAREIDAAQQLEEKVVSDTRGVITKKFTNAFSKSIENMINCHKKLIKQVAQAEQADGALFGDTSEAYPDPSTEAGSLIKVYREEFKVIVSKTFK